MVYCGGRLRYDGAERLKTEDQSRSRTEAVCGLRGTELDNANRN